MVHQLQKNPDELHLTEKQEKAIISYINETGPLNIPQEKVDELFESVCATDERINFREYREKIARKTKLISDMLNLGVLPRELSEELACILIDLKKEGHPKLEEVEIIERKPFIIETEGKGSSYFCCWPYFFMPNR